VERFPCLSLATVVAGLGGTAPAVLNAANEVAVNAFLERRLSFTDIPRAIDAVLQQHSVRSVGSLDDVLAADEWSRRQAQAAVAQLGSATVGAYA
jgi:1-deoxy-D-xylulose-5-phosphate reductoisomerase